MSKIIVGLADADEQQNAIAALRLKKHTVDAIDPIAPDDDPADVAREILNANIDVAVLDYIVEDAASVKMLQAVTDSSDTPRFIFVMPPDVPVSHIMMAMNEGAYAVLPRPLAAPYLENYVERATAGPGRFRKEQLKNDHKDEEIAEVEKRVKTMRIQMTAYRKLISYLMSTPTAEQHRKALIVSDSSYQRDYLRKLFEDHGFQVFTAPNPEAGLAAALEDRPLIVISDLEMEGMNGVEFCKELKINRKFVPCHFVICTASGEKVGAIMAPGNGVDACVLKPSSENDNLEIIANAAMGLLL